MKKLFILLTLLLTGQFLNAQSTITKTFVRNNGPIGNHQLFRITTPKGRLNNGKFEKALTQNDIIGNDYLTDYRIFGKNRNGDGSHTPTNYIPIDGFKRTFCGPLHSHYYSGGFFDKDQCIELQIDEDNPLIKGYKYLYDKYRYHYRFPGVDTNWFYQPWNIIEGEINNGSAEATMAFSDLQSQVCMYGPWVLELYDSTELHLNSHKNNNEIHPIEQFWYKAAPVAEGNSSYKMNFFVDGSQRFDSKGDYYGIQPNENLLFKPWSKAPMDGKFYLAFEVNLKRKERLTYWIEPLNSLGVKPPQDDGKAHLLMYGADTLIRLFEGSAETVNIGFDNVGFKPLKGNRVDSSILQGFLVFSTRIVGVEKPIPFSVGHFNLRVEKQTRSFVRQTLLFTIEKIKRLQPNSFRHFNPVTNTTYTDPNPVPSGFNERQVLISLSSGKDSMQELVSNLETGQEKTFDRLQITREGFLTDEYRFVINCQNGVNGSELGRLTIAGKEPVSNSEIRKTIVYFAPNVRDSENQADDDDHAMRSLRVSLFAITYKITALPVRADTGDTK